MEQVQKKLPLAVWRVFKVVPAVLQIIPRHRERVLGVDDVERELAPAIAAFLPAAVDLRTYDATREVSDSRRAANLERLRQRTRYWLTYVRIDLPKYAASRMKGRLNSPDVVIDRARGLIDVARSYSVELAPRYAAPLLAEMSPLHEQCVTERSDARDTAKQMQRLRGDVRELALPVYEGINLLRLLLRNELGASDVDVRALNMDPPARSKREVEVDATPSITAPTTSQRMAIGQA